MAQVSTVELITTNLTEVVASVDEPTIEIAIIGNLPITGAEMVAAITQELGGASWQLAPTGTGNFVHIQGTPSDTWTIDHNLGYPPNVTLFDGANQEFQGVIEHVAPAYDTTFVHLKFPYSGMATCS